MSRDPQAAAYASANEAQDAFLGAAFGANVTLYLVNGVRVQGVLALQDKFTLLLSSARVSLLVYKHAVATVVPEPQTDSQLPASKDGRTTDGGTLARF